MDSWNDVAIPAIPGEPPQLRLYTSVLDAVAPVASQAQYRMYVCGITPYDATHLGHAATYVAFDMVNRQLRDAGGQVRYVQNVTDIDDPLLERAERDGVDWRSLAVSQTELFREDMQALRVIPPDHYIGAVESMDIVSEAVSALRERGAAYQLDDGTGDYYQDVTSMPNFGYVSQYDEATMLELSAQRGGDPDRPGKRHRLDPLLWRGRRDGEPYWESSLGAGRPGWHVECAAIALKYLGPTIDVQGGGSDLRFPHHEYSNAHAEVITGEQPFAGHFTQAGMIRLDGEKMSKSKGNLELVSRLRGRGVDPMAIRLGILAGHYREDRDWSESLITQAQERLDTWRSAISRGGADAQIVIAQMRERLADDLDTPSALRLVDDWATEEVNGGGGQSIAAAVDALLGVKL